MIQTEGREKVVKQLHKQLRDVIGAIQYFFEEQDLFEHMHLLDEAEKLLMRLVE